MKVRWYVTDGKEELGLLEVSKLIRGKVCFCDYIAWRQAYKPWSEPVLCYRNVGVDRIPGGGRNLTIQSLQYVL